MLHQYHGVSFPCGKSMDCQDRNIGSNSMHRGKWLKSPFQRRFFSLRCRMLWLSPVEILKVHYQVLNPNQTYQMYRILQTQEQTKQKRYHNLRTLKIELFATLFFGKGRSAKANLGWVPKPAFNISNMSSILNFATQLVCILSVRPSARFLLSYPYRWVFDGSCSAKKPLAFHSDLYCTCFRTLR